MQQLRVEPYAAINITASELNLDTLSAADVGTQIGRTIARHLDQEILNLFTTGTGASRT